MEICLVVLPSQLIALNHCHGKKEKDHRTFTATPSCPHLEMTYFTSAQCTGLTSHVVPTQLQGGTGSFPMCP